MTETSEKKPSYKMTKEQAVVFRAAAQFARIVELCSEAENGDAQADLLRLAHHQTNNSLDSTEWLVDVVEVLHADTREMFLEDAQAAQAAIIEAAKAELADASSTRPVKKPKREPVDPARNHPARAPVS